MAGCVWFEYLFLITSLLCLQPHRSKTKDTICRQKQKMFCWMLFFWRLKDFVLDLLRWSNFLVCNMIGKILTLIQMLLFFLYLVLWCSEFSWRICSIAIAAINANLSCSLNTSASCCRAWETYWEVFLQPAGSAKPRRWQYCCPRDAHSLARSHWGTHHELLQKCYITIWIWTTGVQLIFF